ncbi:unnamed protein product [Brassica oleracea]
MPRRYLVLTLLKYRALVRVHLVHRAFCFEPFVESLSQCPKHGLHNPFKSPERYLLYGDISTKAAHMLALPKVSDFFTRLIQRVAPKSYQQAAGEVFVTLKFLENFCGDQVRFLARSFAVPGNHHGQQSHGYRWPYGPVTIITPFNFPLEIPLLQLMGALYVGNKPLLKVSIVMEQMMRLLHYCGLPVEDVDFINSDGKTMNKILLEGRIRLEDAGFDWKVLGPDVQEVDYVAWVCDQDAYACSGQKCSAQSMLFMHENWAKTSLVSKLKDLAGRRKLEDLTIGPVLTDIWDSFFGQGGFNQPYGFADVIKWMHHSTPPGKLRTICKLIAQAVFYAIWNERNKRLHTSVARPLQLITKEIKIILKAKLYGMDQNIRNNNRLNSIRHNTIDTYLHSWFQHFSL